MLNADLVAGMQSRWEASSSGFLSSQSIYCSGCFLQNWLVKVSHLTAHEVLVVHTAQLSTPFNCTLAQLQLTALHWLWPQLFVPLLLSQLTWTFLFHSTPVFIFPLSCVPSPYLYSHWTHCTAVLHLKVQSTISLALLSCLYGFPHT